MPAETASRDTVWQDTDSRDADGQGDILPVVTRPGVAGSSLASIRRGFDTEGTRYGADSLQRGKFWHRLVIARACPEKVGTADHVRQAILTDPLPIDGDFGLGEQSFFEAFDLAVKIAKVEPVHDFLQGPYPHFSAPDDRST